MVYSYHHEKILEIHVQVTMIFYNCHFYYRKEAHECPVLCFGQVGGSIIAVPIPKTGYNKNTG